MLFFCVPGERADGHDFAAAAVAAGCPGAGRRAAARAWASTEALVPTRARRWRPRPLRLLRRSDGRAWRSPAVTGTNGKTTTAFLVRHLLETGGVQTGLLGTVKSVVGGVEAEVERTTPEAIDLQATFRAMLDAGDRACAMEVSSHALRLGRADGIRFGVAVFTNLTQDHLDFHADMEDYFAAKRLLFVPETGGAAAARRS